MNLFKNLNNYIPMIFMVLMSIFVMFRNKKYIEFFSLFKNNRWLINLIVIIIFVVYIRIFKKNDVNLINSIKKAILGLVIAIFAYLDMTIAPFWVILILSYYGKDFV